MKKLFFILAFLVISQLNQAQTQIGKGRQMVGGNINFSQSSNDRTDTTGSRPVQKFNSSFYSAGIHYGYFVTDHIMLGVNGTFVQSLMKTSQHYPANDYSSTQTNQTFNFGIFSRYYYMLGKSKFAVYGQLGLNYGSGNGNTKNITNINSSLITEESKNTTFNYGASLIPGITYFINKTFAVETSLGSIAYNMQNTKTYEYGSKISEVNDSRFNSNLLFTFSSINIGFNIYFGGKKTEPELPK